MRNEWSSKLKELIEEFKEIIEGKNFFFEKKIKQQ